MNQSIDSLFSELRRPRIRSIKSILEDLIQYGEAAKLENLPEDIADIIQKQSNRFRWEYCTSTGSNIEFR